MTEREIRDRKHPIKVYVTPGERAEIERRASGVKFPPSTLMRVLALGFEPKSVFDPDGMAALIRLYAEQEQLSGMLKDWLSEKQGGRPGAGVAVSDVRAILSRIENLQTALARLVMAEKKRL